MADFGHLCHIKVKDPPGDPQKGPTEPRKCCAPFMTGYRKNKFIVLTYEVSINSFTGWPICENIIEIIFFRQKPSEPPFLDNFEKGSENGGSEGFCRKNMISIIFSHMGHPVKLFIHTSYVSTNNLFLR